MSKKLYTKCLGFCYYYRAKGCFALLEIPQHRLGMMGGKGDTLSHESEGPNVLYAMDIIYHTVYIIQHFINNLYAMAQTFAPSSA